MILFPSPETLKKAADILLEEVLVAFPTETVYGLGGLARSDTAVKKIFQAKGRPSYNPLIVHVSSLDQAKEIALFSPLLEKTVSFFWPGPLTVVAPLREGAGISPLATAGLKTVALRFSNHPLLTDLLRLVKEPLVAPSANASGFLSSTTAHHVQKSLPNTPVLNGGETREGVESTIICIEGDKISLLRPGALSLEEIEKKTKTSVFVNAEQKTISSPGQTKHHYAPSLPLRTNVVHPEEREAFLGFGKTEAPTHLNLSPKGSLEEAAHNLFSFLHTLDTPLLYKGISVSPIPNTGVGVAINDRLRRASLSKA
ncbi:L-threonylcarbamoyladenylate synthase [Alphaproteobacteria bacterium]|nr:L-threonylcarbamoyladenylate synthase [Alphaproteobacteria bacterium]